MSSWHHERLVAEGWELTAAPVAAPASRVSPGSALPARPGCACAMSRGQLSATAQCSVKSCFFTQLEPVPSGLCCRTELSRTGKSCAAGALLISLRGAKLGLCPASPCVRAPGDIYRGASAQRVLANPVTKRTVMSILFCLFFFFQMCTNHFRKSLSRFA